MIEKTPLEAWINKKISVNPTETFTREAIEAYQLKKLKESIEWVKQKSKFYRRTLIDLYPEDIKDLKDIEKLPFTTPKDIRENAWQFISVPQDSIHRIVTIQTSGTTGISKRIYFTEEEQEQTIDFFHHGMSTLVEKGDNVLILLPGQTPGSVGDLLQKGLKRLGAYGIIYGSVNEPKIICDLLKSEPIDAIVGIPKQLLAIARLGSQIKGKNTINIKSVLLSTDYVPNAIINELKNTWDCKVFEHYGITEMGFGGGVACKAFEGYHLREADLYFEIINPVTGKVLKDGEYGEVVFTTLTRKGMPLIRYRTGDWGRFIPGACPCGTILKRLDKILYRIENKVYLNENKSLTISELDEILFSVRGILDYDAILSKKENRDQLTIRIQFLPREAKNIYNDVYKVIMTYPMLAELIQQDKLSIEICNKQGRQKICNGTQKRIILDKR